MKSEPELIIILMQRRDIFNLLFKGSSFDEPIRFEPDPVLATPAYLCTDHMTLSYKEWTAFSPGDKFPLELSAQYSFSLTFGFNYPEITNFPRETHLVLALVGIKAESPHDVIKLGIENGCIFIDKIKDQRIIPQMKLAGDIQLILTVNPQPDGKSYAKLKAVDQSGLTLSTIKTSQFSITDWIGEIDPGMQFNFLRIEGWKPN